jgi:hypothetical protein
MGRKMVGLGHSYSKYSRNDVARKIHFSQMQGEMAHPRGRVLLYGEGELWESKCQVWRCLTVKQTT